MAASIQEFRGKKRSHNGLGRRRKWPLRLLFCWMMLAGAMEASDAVAKDYQVKAAFLFNFTKFVEWPEQRFESATQPIVIGILGPNPFGEELTQILHDRRVAGRTLIARTVATDAEACNADLLYVCAGQERRFELLRERLLKAGVLTVGEADTFVSSGVIITFIFEAEKVRFEIDQGAAERAGIKISAQLLKVAAYVRGGGRTKS